MDGAVGAEQSSTRGHGSHVYALRWSDEHTLLSGGWDNVVHVWDVRQAQVVRSISGERLRAWVEGGGSIG
jgi:WD40 repeat protein